MRIISKYIDSFATFDETVAEFKAAVAQQSKQAQKDYIAVFRGVQEDGTRYLVPSLTWKGLEKYEYDLIGEMKRFKPLEFNDIHGLDLLGKCRHYNLPSRLLDFSRSHYVALFFAVTEIISKTNHTKHHKVYCISANTRNDTVVDNICNISTKLQPFMYNLDKQDTNALIESITKLKEDSDIKNFITKSLYSPLFINPKFYTAREQNQQSVFLIFPNKITDIIGGFDFQVSNWTELLNAETSFVNRFKFVPRLHNPLLDSEDKADDLCWELLIPTNIIGELKEKLDSMGIDEAFLFPDNLEYTVEKIEKMYLKKLQV